MIIVPKGLYDDMIAHAKKRYPEEACGFVAGKGGQARAFYPIENMDHSTVSYLMDPKQQMKAFRDMDANRLELAAIFHSHVASAATPSQKDKTLAAYPDVSYLIVSLSDMQKPDLRSFRIVDGKDMPEELRVL